MKTYQIAPLKTAAGDLPVTVRDDGTFIVELHGESVWANSIDALKAKLGKALTEKPARVEVEIHGVDNGKLVEGVAVGIHGANHNVLVRWSGGRGIVQLRSYESTVMRRLSPEEALQFNALWAAVTTASAALATFREEHTINVSKAVKDAIAKLGKETA